MVRVKRRYGLIEIGSRAIRMLVADVDESDNLTILDKNAKSYSVNEVSYPLMHDNSMLLNEIVNITQSLQNRCFSHNPEIIFTFGTDMLRRMDHQSLNILTEQVGHIVVLGKKDEGLCSLVASTIHMPPQLKVADKISVIDQGKGSTELAFGEKQDVSFKLLSAKSYKLGTRILTDLLHQSQNRFEEFNELVEKKIAKYKLFVPNGAENLVLMGSAATKLAAIKTRKFTNENYSPEKVHGVELTLYEMDQFLSESQKNPARFGGIVDPFNPQSNEFETVFCGLSAISNFVRKIQPTRIFVNGLGTRYGIPILLANSDKRILKYINADMS